MKCSSTKYTPDVHGSAASMAVANARCSPSGSHRSAMAARGGRSVRSSGNTSMPATGPTWARSGCLACSRLANPKENTIDVAPRIATSSKRRPPRCAAMPAAPANTVSAPTWWVNPYSTTDTGIAEGLGRGLVRHPQPAADLRRGQPLRPQLHRLTHLRIRQLRRSTRPTGQTRRPLPPRLTPKLRHVLRRQTQHLGHPPPGEPQPGQRHRDHVAHAAVITAVAGHSHTAHTHHCPSIMDSGTKVGGLGHPLHDHLNRRRHT